LQIIAEAYSDNEKGVQTNPALQTVQIAEEMHVTDIVDFCDQQDHRAARFRARSKQDQDQTADRLLQTDLQIWLQTETASIRFTDREQRTDAHPAISKH